MASNEEHIALGLALQLVENYATRQTELGNEIKESDAQLFMRNTVQLIHALLNTDVKPSDL